MDTENVRITLTSCESKLVSISHAIYVDNGKMCNTAPNYDTSCGDQIEHELTYSEAERSVSADSVRSRVIPR